jgi:hypothetical protein
MSTAIATVAAAMSSTNGLAAMAAPRSPPASAVEAVVSPHSGHGIPVISRSGQKKRNPTAACSGG